MTKDAAAEWDHRSATLAAAKAAAWPDGHDELWARRHLRQLEGMPYSGHVADVGAGWGRLALPMLKARPNLHVWSVDISINALRHLASAADSWRSHTVRTPGGGLPTDMLPPRLDGAWSVLMFQHVDTATQRQYLTDLAGLLRPDAPLVVQFVHPADPGPYSHQLEPAEAERWCAALCMDSRIEADRYRPHTWWLHAKGRTP